MSDAHAIDSSLHIAGLQCERRLWLAARMPALGASDARAAERSARARTRRELCESAAELFADLRPVADADEGRAIARTRELLADPAVGAIRDAVVSAQGATARVDFIERLSGSGFGLRVVRAALRPSESTLDELAFDSFVARAAGLAIASVEVILLDGEFTRGADAPEARTLFRRANVTRDVAFLAEDLEARLVAQRESLARTEAPEVEPSPHCRRPDTCEFLAHCTVGKRADWIGYLPGLRANPYASLRAAGVERIGELPEGFATSPAQRNARASFSRGTAFAASDLARRLESFGAHSDTLDFEAILPEIPIFAGTRPFEVVPFQWSAHLAQGDAGFAHAEFLADGGGDPRRAFASSLLAAFGQRVLPIAVYSGFESEVLIALGRAFPDLAAELERVRERLRDLLPVMRRAVYHPAFLGSFSLKRVAPALCAGFSFSDLPGIADGGAASRAWLALARGELSLARAAEVLAELHAYCAHDSLALALLLPRLRALASA
jgi:hypothetical protein